MSRVLRSRIKAPALAAAALLWTVASAAPPAHAADPKIGDCLMAAESSLKLRGEHKLRLARTQLLVCSAASCPLEVRQECMKRIDEVNAASPTIVVAVKTPAGKELTAVKVSVDGQVVAEQLDGSALSVDPGAHEFTFEARGEPIVTETIVLHEGEKDRRETVTLGTPEAAQTVAAPAPSTKPGPSESPAEGASSEGSPLRTVGLVVGGVGVAGIAVGTVFGVLASSAWQTAQQDCPSPHTNCSSKAMNEHNNAVTDATISTVGFIAGGVLAATGVTLYLVAPKSTASGTVGLRASPGGFAVTGEF